MKDWYQKQDVATVADEEKCVIGVMLRVYGADRSVVVRMMREYS